MGVGKKRLECERARLQMDDKGFGRKKNLSFCYRSFIGIFLSTKMLSRTPQKHLINVLDSLTL